MIFLNILLGTLLLKHTLLEVFFLPQDGFRILISLYCSLPNTIANNQLKNSLITDEILYDISKNNTVCWNFNRFKQWGRISQTKLHTIFKACIQEIKYCMLTREYRINSIFNSLTRA